MTTLREAAQQALEALEDMLGWQSLAPQTIQESAKGRAAALRSALAEPVQEPKPVAYIDALKDAFFEGFTSVATYNDMLLNSPEEAWEKYKPPRITPPQRPAEPVQEPVAWIEHEWAGTGLRKLHFEKRDPTVRDEVVNPVWTPLYTAPPQRPAEPQGCDHCNHPLYAATKCRVCGRVTEVVQEPDSPERRCGGPGCDGTCCQPVQEPVAYSEGRTLHWHDGKGVNDAQLYLAPPQRKPLSEDEIFKIENGIPDDVIGDRAWTICFARAIERVHGIGGQPRAAKSVASAGAPTMRTPGSVRVRQYNREEQ